MAVFEPSPISAMAMTAATPMTMPSVVNAERMTLRRRACRAIFAVWSSFIKTSAPILLDRGLPRSANVSSPGFPRHPKLRGAELMLDRHHRDGRLAPTEASHEQDVVAFLRQAKVKCQAAGAATRQIEFVCRDAARADAPE